TLIQEEADEDANIIFGAVIDESMGDEVRITVIATGFGDNVTATAKPGARETRETAPPPAPPVETRPVKRLGLLVEDELDVPAYQRRRQDGPVATAARNAQRASTPAGKDESEEYDLPTFLRRGTD